MFDFNNSIIKGMLENNLTNEQFEKVKEMYEQRQHLEDIAKRGPDFSVKINKGIRAEDINQATKSV